MNQPLVIGIASGLLQFGLACYAFRFARHLGKPQIGWPLFITLSLLAACTLLLSAKLHFEHIASAPGLNILYAAFSFFLFIGLVRFDRSLRKYRRPDLRSARASYDSESSSDNSVDELTRVNEELRQRAGGLEREMFEQVEAQKRLEGAYKELIVSIGTRMPAAVEPSQPETEAQPAVSLQTKPDPQPEPAANPQLAFDSQPVIALQAAIDSSPEPATQTQPAPQPEAEAHIEPVLQAEPGPETEQPQEQAAMRSDENIRRQEEISILMNNVTVSVGSLAEHLVRCEAANTSLSRLAKLMNTHARSLGGFMTSDPRGRQLPASLSQLTKQLANEQSLLAKQIASIKKRLTQVNTTLISAPQIIPDGQSPSAGITQGEEQFHYSLQDGQTETAVSTETGPQQSDSPETASSLMDGELEEMNVDSQDGGDTGVFIKL